MAVPLIAAAALMGYSAEAVLVKEKTPPMGWNSYNTYACNPTEEIIKSNAQGLVDLGLADLGYNVVTTDCGWPETERNAEGQLVWNTTLFPSGPEALTEYIHDLGLKAGMYSGGGYYQCGSTDIPASLGFEEIDAQSFSDWKGDALKYDNCYAVDEETMVDSTSPVAVSPTRFQHMANVLDNVEREISYYICQWGVGTNVGDWAAPIGNTIRISNDIYDNWRSIWRITNQAVPWYKHTTVGAYADLDMLLVGLGGLSVPEEKFHFSMWAMHKTPLKIGARLEPDATPQESIDILANTEVIAINQDPLGEAVRLVRRDTENEWDVWAGALSNDRIVLGISNWRNDSQSVEFDIAATLDGVASAGKARDVWAHEDLPEGLSGVITFNLGPHEMRVLVLSDLETSESSPKPGKFYTAANATLAGPAQVVTCEAQDCEPAGAKVGNLIGEASVSFTDSVSATTGGAKTLGVRYINYDQAFDTAWGWGDNTRNLTVAVNGGEARRWAFPISGGDWWESDTLLIDVDGFEAGSANTVVFGAYGEDSNGPDLVGFEVYE